MESLGVGLDTFRALVALEQREIEPEDYELLSRLHANANTLKFTKADQCGWHRDRGNRGESLIAFMGNFTGGGLELEDGRTFKQKQA